MPAGYERLTELHGVLVRASELSVPMMIFDVEPLVAWWDSGQESLDRAQPLLFRRDAPPGEQPPEPPP